MSKSIVISERDNIAAVIEDGKAVEFFINRGDMLLGDVYLAAVENILPSIDAAFVNLGGDKMGFLHASDVNGKGALKDRLKPKQSVLVQIMKEPTGHKGPRVTTSISLPGRFLVFMPDEKGISVSRKISSVKERSRLKSIVSLLKPVGVGVIIRTEAEGQAESEIQEDLELLVERWNNIVTAGDTVKPPNLLYRDQDLLYRVIREACTEEIKDIILDTQFALHRANQLLQSWNIGHDINVTVYKGNEPLLVNKGIDKEIRSALQTKILLPSGGYLYIQTTEALTVIDVNSGKFTSSATQDETIRKTNLEAISEIARQLKLRNIGGMIIIDFIDMENRVDQLAILEELEIIIEKDKSKPQIGQLSDLGLVELTRHRQGQSLAEVFTKKCPACSGTGAIIEEFNFAPPPQDGDLRLRTTKLKAPQKISRIKPQHQQLQQNGSQNQAAKNQQQSNQQPKQASLVTQALNQHERPQQHEKPQQPQPQKVIKTYPSIISNLTQKPKKVEKAELKITDLSEEDIKQLINKKGHIPNLSRIIKISAIPPKIAREHMPPEYIMDVFTILQEIETGEVLFGSETNQPQVIEDNNIVPTYSEYELKPAAAVIPEVQEEPQFQSDNENNDMQAPNDIQVIEDVATKDEKKPPVRRGRKPKSDSLRSSRPGRKPTPRNSK